MYLPKLSASVLAVLFCFVPHAAAQVGVGTGIWEFVDGDDLRSAMVVIRGDQTGSTGSGCVIAIDQVLTASHVVDADGSFSVSFDDGQVRAASVQARDGDADVAVLRCDTPEGCGVVPVAEAAKEGEDVRVFGFGGGQGLRVWKSKIAAVGERSLLLFSYAIPGDSGGPVVNAAGQVVGVVSGGSVWAKRKIKTAAGTVHSLTAPVRAGTCERINRLLRR